MRRSPRLALALLMAAAPLTAEEKCPATAARRSAVSAAACAGKAETQVSCDVKLVRVSDAVLEKMKFQSGQAPPAPRLIQREFGNGLVRVGVSFEAEPPASKRRVQFATAAEMKTLLDEFQKSPAASVVAAPKITLLSGEPATVEILDRHCFVTDVTADSVGGKQVMTPKLEVVDVGAALKLTATAAPGAQAVTLAVAATVTELGEAVTPLKPLTVVLKTTLPDGKPQAVPYTQFVQQPKVITRAVKDILAVPAGQSAILYAGAATHERREEFTPPALAKIPYLNRLYKNVGHTRETDHLLVIVTPRVLADETCCADKCPASAPVKLLGDTQLKLLLKAYQDACADDRPDDARRLAIECLALDPTCFGKK